MQAAGGVATKLFGENHLTADWKNEKHVPVIECPDQVKSGEIFQVQVTIGKEVPHPNKTEHHIRWIDLNFLPEGEKLIFEIGRFGFAAHGKSAKWANQGPVYTHHEITARMKTEKPGTLYATSFCNIHGLWLSQKGIKVS